MLRRQAPTTQTSPRRSWLEKSRHRIWSDCRQPEATIPLPYQRRDAAAQSETRLIPLFVFQHANARTRQISGAVEAATHVYLSCIWSGSDGIDCNVIAFEWGWLGGSIIGLDEIIKNQSVDIVLVDRSSDCAARVQKRVLSRKGQKDRFCVYALFQTSNGTGAVQED